MLRVLLVKRFIDYRTIAYKLDERQQSVISATLTRLIMSSIRFASTTVVTLTLAKEGRLFSAISARRFKTDSFLKLGVHMHIAMLSISTIAFNDLSIHISFRQNDPNGLKTPPCRSALKFASILVVY